MSIVAIIPARGGSVRIPRKSIKDFHGKPIIAYSIEAAKASGLFDAVYVSTEDVEIADVARKYGAQVINRTPELAEIGAADCGTQEITRHALMTLGITEGYACCIYPCAPMIDARDLLHAYENAQKHPYNYVYAKGQFYFGFAKRFIFTPDDFTHCMEMMSLRYIDINAPEDWERAEHMYEMLK